MSNLKTKFKNLFISNAEKQYIVDNISIMLASGIDIIDTIESIKTQVRSRFLRELLDKVILDIGNGLSISTALGKINILPLHSISLIRAGESSGNLSDNLIIASTQEQKNRDFKSKIQSAMLYPVMIITITVLAATGVSIFVLPQLAKLISSLGADLPLSTQIIIFLGSNIQKYGFIIIPGIFILMALSIYILFVNSRTKILGEKILLNTPGIKKLLLEIELARMSYLLGSLLKAGLPLTESLTTVAGATTLQSYRRIYEDLEKNIQQGVTFEKSFKVMRKAKKLIPPPIQQMIISAERSGKLSDTFEKISAVYENKSKLTTDNIVVLIEPVFLIIVWLVVMFVALSIILPIYNLIGSVSI